MDVFSFVAAASNSGKTTLIEKVVKLIKAKGLSVAVIKHATKGFDLHHPELDGYLKAGAETVIFVGNKDVAVIRTIHLMPSIEEMHADVGDIDITIYEGFKEDAGNKIEVFRYGVSGIRPLCMDDPSYIALATDTKFKTILPQFDLNDTEGVANFIMEKFGHES